MNRLAELRKAAGYTQKYVALELGVKAPSVCAWEKGDGNPKQENLIALAKLYGVSVDYLLGNDKQEWEPAGRRSDAGPVSRNGRVQRARYQPLGKRTFCPKGAELAEAGRRAEMRPSEAPVTQKRPPNPGRPLSTGDALLSSATCSQCFARAFG